MGLFDSLGRGSVLTAGLPAANQYFLLTAAPPPVVPPMQTFADDCTTPKTTFNLGETVCAVATGLSGFRFAWADPDGFIIRKAAITADSQSDSNPLPSTDTTDVGNLGLFTANNLGTWRVNAITSRNSVKTGAFFTVKDPDNARVDLSITQTLISDAPAAGDSVQYSVVITNNGPDDAANVHFVDNSFTNATFNSVTQPGGPTFTCSGAGSADCTIALLPSGSVAEFLLSFTAGTAGAELSNTASVSSSTTELNPADNSFAVGDTRVGAGNPTPTCVLTCPSNITLPADTVEGGQAGAHVTFADPTTSGTCGTTITTSVASGSFFPVGTTVVTSTSDDGICRFTVTIEPPVTISCPADQTAEAGPNCNANVSVGTPTTTGDNVTVDGSRSDGLPLTDPYPVGTTTITWQATSHSGLPADDTNSTGSVSCQQVVTVSDKTGPTITAPALSASADASCQAAVPDFFGTGGATASDNCSDPSAITVGQDIAPGTAVGIGPHTVTLTATDESGNITTKTTTFTVNDTTPPAFTFVPPAITVNTGPGATSCDAQVDPGTATAADNCGTVNITRSPSGNTFPVGDTTVTWTATDAAGNTATATQHVIVIDNTPPVVSPPPNITVYLPLHSTVTSMAVNYPTPATATDNCDGPIPASRISYSPASGSIFPVGTTAVTVTATDSKGNSATAAFTVTVLYDFTGFFSPINNQPTLNLVKAGSAVPVKFSLSGNKGLGIFAVGSPTSIGMNCTTDQVIDVTETVTAGGSSLNYDPTSDQYNYVWKTDGSWGGLCRQLVVTLNDGSRHVANFKFK